MDVWLIANVGQRDLQLDGRPLDAKCLRAEGARIEGEYEALKDKVSAPMLSAGLAYIRSRVDGAKVRVLLVATDQEDARFREGDTVTCAGALKRLLTQRYGGLVARVQVRTAAQPPNLYDRMLHFYETHGLARLEPDAEQYYLLLAGGTPAANAALLLAGVWRFREKVCALSVGEGAGQVRPMDVGRRIVASYRTDRVKELLERRDFAGAAALLGPDTRAGRAADAAAKRLSLDFAPCLVVLDRLLAEGGGSAPAEIDVLYAETQRLAAGERTAVMREVYWNAMVKWRRDEYADFLGRVWRLQEAALQEAVGRVCGLDLRDKYVSGRAFEKWVRERPALLECLEKKSREPVGRIEQSSWLLGVILEGLIALESNRADAVVLRACHKAVRLLDGLRNLRNKCVLAHGFEGLSRKAILDQIETGDEQLLYKELEALLAVWNAVPGLDPYEQFAAAIMKLMAESA